MVEVEVEVGTDDSMSSPSAALGAAKGVYWVKNVDGVYVMGVNMALLIVVSSSVGLVLG